MIKQWMKRGLAVTLTAALLVVGINYIPVQEEVQAATQTYWDEPLRYYEEGQYGSNDAIDLNDERTYVATQYHSCDSMWENFRGSSTTLPSVIEGGKQTNKYALSVDSGSNSKVEGTGSLRVVVDTTSNADIQTHFINGDGLDVEEYKYFRFWVHSTGFDTHGAFQIIFQTDYYEYIVRGVQAKYGSGYCYLNDEDGNEHYIFNEYYNATDDKNGNNATSGKKRFITLRNKGETAEFRANIDSYTVNHDWKQYTVDISDLEGVVNNVILRYTECAVSGTSANIRYDNLEFIKSANHDDFWYNNDFKNVSFNNTDQDSTGLTYASGSAGSRSANYTTTCVEGTHSMGVTVDKGQSQAKFYFGATGALNTSDARNSEKFYLDTSGGYDYEELRFRVLLQTGFTGAQDIVVYFCDFNATSGLDGMIQHMQMRTYAKPGSVIGSNQWQEISLKLPSNIEYLLQDGFHLICFTFTGLAQSTTSTANLYVDDLKFVTKKTVKKSYPAGKYLMVNDFDSMNNVRTNQKVYSSQLYTVNRREDVMASQTTYAGTNQNIGGYVLGSDASTKITDSESTQTNNYVYCPTESRDEDTMVTQGYGATMMCTPEKITVGSSVAGYSSGITADQLDGKGIVRALYYKQLTDDPANGLDLSSYTYLSFDLFLACVGEHQPGVMNGNLALQLSLVTDTDGTVANGTEDGYNISIYVPCANRSGGISTNGAITFVNTELFALDGFNDGYKDPSSSNDTTNFGQSYTAWGSMRVIISMHDILSGYQEGKGADITNITHMRLVMPNGTYTYQEGDTINTDISDRVSDSRDIRVVLDNMVAFTPDREVTLDATNVTGDYLYDVNAEDETPTLTYHVQGNDLATKEVDMYVTVPVGGTTTLRNLPGNSYKITMVTPSWRYTETGEGTDDVWHVGGFTGMSDTWATQSGLDTYMSNNNYVWEHTTKLNLTRTQIYWLDGYDTKVNTFASP